MKPDVWIPDGRAQEAALARTTHMGVVAHPDDLEIEGYPGIAECFGRDDRWFCGVVVTDGAGSLAAGLRSGGEADLGGANAICPLDCTVPDGANRCSNGPSTGSASSEAPPGKWA